MQLRVRKLQVIIPSAVAGATQKIDCPPGTYSFTSSVECTSCPMGWFQPGYAGKECMQCPRGKSTLINGSRICIGKDCKWDEYLNNTFTVFSDWLCKACPEGALCNISTDKTWSGVIAKAGYYCMPGLAPQHLLSASLQLRAWATLLR